MNDNVREMDSTTYHQWIEDNKNNQVDLESRYIKKLLEYIQQFGYSETDVNFNPMDNPSDSIKGMDLTYDPEYDKRKRNLRSMSMEIYQFDDDWFILKFWENFPENDISKKYLCDQFDSLMNQLDKCFKTFPKLNDPKWNQNIKLEFEKRRDKLLKKALDRTTKHIMSFTTFKELDQYEDSL